MKNKKFLATSAEVMLEGKTFVCESYYAYIRAEDIFNKEYPYLYFEVSKVLAAKGFVGW